VLLAEKLQRFQIDEPEEKKKEWWWRPKFREEPTGLLMFQLEHSLFDGTRRTWADGKKTAARKHSRRNRYWH
jgi:hypothetical protein